MSIQNVARQVGEQRQVVERLRRQLYEARTLPERSALRRCIAMEAAKLLWFLRYLNAEHRVGVIELEVRATDDALRRLAMELAAGQSHAARRQLQIQYRLLLGRKQFLVQQLSLLRTNGIEADERPIEADDVDSILIEAETAEAAIRLGPQGSQVDYGGTDFGLATVSKSLTTTTSSPVVSVRPTLSTSTIRPISAAPAPSVVTAAPVAAVAATPTVTAVTPAPVAAATSAPASSPVVAAPAPAASYVPSVEAYAPTTPAVQAIYPQTPPPPTAGAELDSGEPEAPEGWTTTQIIIAAGIGVVVLGGVVYFFTARRA